MDFRWFPFLGFKTLSDEEKDLYSLPVDVIVKALTFEWLHFKMILVGKVYLDDGDVDGN